MSALLKRDAWLRAGDLARKLDAERLAARALWLEDQANAKVADAYEAARVAHLAARDAEVKAREEWQGAMASASEKRR